MRIFTTLLHFPTVFNSIFDLIHFDYFADNNCNRNVRVQQFYLSILNISLNFTDLNQAATIYVI